MSTRALRRTRWTTLPLGVAAVIALILWLPYATTLASSHSAERSFAASWAAPGAEFEVTVTLRDYGGFALLEETLPDGFEYRGANLRESGSVVASGQVVTFTLLGAYDSVTYVVRAPQTAGSYTFSGELKDQGREARKVGGATIIRIGAAPTATPIPPTATSTPTAVPTATPTPEPTNTPTPAPTATPIPPTATSTPTAVPTATPTPEPTNTPTPAPTATPIPPTATSTPTAVPTATPTPEPTNTPTPTAVPTATPTPEPTNTPTPAPTVTPTPVATATPLAAPVEDGGLPSWMPAALFAAGALLLIALLWMRVRRRR